MKTHTNTLVGIDYSDNGVNALREAARVAHWNQGNLHGLHIIEDEVISLFREQKDFDELKVMHTALTHLKEYVEDILGPDHSCQCRLRVGHPFHEMLDEIQSRQADLLVLGSRGLSEKTLHNVGSLAQRCVRKAPTHVLLVRQKQDSPYQNIIACTDFSNTANRAAQIAADMAIQDGASLELVHFYTYPIYPYGDVRLDLDPAPGFIDSLMDNQKKKLNHLANKLQASHPSLDIKTSIVEDSISHAIGNYIKDSKVDLVVLGTRGRTGLKSLFLGTKAEKIIRVTPCSILAVKPDGFHYDLS
ncbi:MAG: universal stress protein [Verrucomicrobiae bacterium]|nr:universal stress protein [Verrucomicrobiae bacterium]NNJ43810.1 universal stress protein [Akkermansiaceae bacterium]